MSAPVQRRYAAESLREFMRAVMVHFGTSEPDAEVAAESLIHADLSGVDTHGISNFLTHWHYAPGLADGSVAARPTIVVQRDSPVAASWDGGHGLGPVVAHRAMTAAIGKAEATGIGMVTVRNGCHFGAHGWLAALAARHDMIAMTASNTAPAAVPPGGLDKVVGTNPFGFAAPVAGSEPFVLDMATTAASGTRVLAAAHRGEPVPWGILADEHGEVTTDSSARLRGGGLLPLGSTAEAGAYKGLGLALAVDILSGVLSGNGAAFFSTFGPQWQVGYWVAAWRVDAFTDLDGFKGELRRSLDAIRATTPAPGRDMVSVPGDRSAETRHRRRVEGIPLPDALVDAADALEASTGVPFPPPMHEP